ncbi:MAG TPA: ergothioneine biosynthesis protein EgtB [Acidimicrobiales bacterium]|nr:ergothioneine biosynthesis protein EgtB [Acidimicrobiales bacterium]
MEPLADRYVQVRSLTEALASPLSAEDQTVQSMPDVSPTKWHRGHTSWFFETFLLEPHGYPVHHPAYGYIFNSYYEAVGARHPRAERGLVSRPGIDEVARYRAHVDAAMADLLGGDLAPEAADLAVLGLHHEQQHQELLLMDIKHVLSRNPLLPAYAEPATPPPAVDAAADKPGWVEHRGGPVDVGHPGGGFAYDNELPRHRTQLVPFALADRTVTCGEWLAFMDDGGYHRPELWLSDGWAAVQAQGRTAPLYWSGPDGHHDPTGGDRWHLFTLAGHHPVDPARPVCHVDYYEADAFARWAGGRLPTEFEWEAVATPFAADEAPADDNLLASNPLGDLLHPAGGAGRWFGDVWEWTASSYAPYPGFRPAAGAVGEYNGKFMVNQYVLRGGSCCTPVGHLRPTYRNFFPAGARWAFSGVRLAKDLRR